MTNVRSPEPQAVLRAGYAALLVRGLLTRQPQGFVGFRQLDPTQEIGLGSVEQRNYSYDPAGRRTGVSGAENATYGYDWRNQPTRTSDDVSSTRVTYDGLGRPVFRETEAKYSSEAVTSSFFGGAQLGSVSTLHGASSNVWGVFGQLAGMDSEVTGEARWALLDRLGSVVAEAGGIADVAGADIRELASYAEFGLPSYETGGFTSPYGFTGELQDAGTGVVAFASRSYDAASGTWMAPDAWPGLLVQPQSLNRYAYVLGDPVTFVDVGGFAATLPKTVLNPSALLNHYTPSGGAGTWNSSNAYGDRALTASGQTVAAGAGGSSPNTVSQTILQDRHADAVRVCTSNALSCLLNDKYSKDLITDKSLAKLKELAGFLGVSLGELLRSVELGSGFLTEIMLLDSSTRVERNKSVTQLALVLASAAGATCNTASNGLIVCGGASWGYGGGGTTYGEVFITPYATVSNGVLAHEQVHSAQWAAQGPALFIPMYFLEMGVSYVVSGDIACEQWYEKNANLADGNYTRC